jgi:CheY-like chemotaxis protein
MDVLLKLALLALIFSHTQLSRADDPYSGEYKHPSLVENSYLREKNQRAAAEQQERFRVRVAIPDAVRNDIATAFAASRAARENQRSAKTQFPSALPGLNRQNLLVASLFLLVAGVLAIRNLAPHIVVYLNPHFDPWAVSSTAAPLPATVRAEDEAFSEFAASFQTGPAIMSSSSNSTSETNPLNEFLTHTPRLLDGLRKFVQKIPEARDMVGQKRMMLDLGRDVQALKKQAGLPELLPVWQMTAALEGLVKQLTNNAGNLTSSTLRTVAGGVDVLDDLCRASLKADILTNPPIRLLVVDDDLICRKVVSLALNKAFKTPDLAAHGAAALALAAERAYDAIFLDVQMPGMDGFEVCTKIHETVPNAKTPVVFVTCLSDFDSRAKSVLSGGSDLIAKPFLTFEITVKALTLALHGRLQANPQTADASHRAVNGSPARSPALAVASPVQNRLQRLSEDTAAAAVPKLFADDHRQGHLLVGPISSGGPLPADLTAADLTRASAQLAPLQDLIQATFLTTDEHACQEVLRDFSLRFNTLMPKVNSAKGHPALRLSAALEGMLKKLLQNPKYCTSSSLLTIATAVDLFQELCAIRVRPDLATNPPIRLLAVDDDPMARRAITCALQMAFDKPDNVDSGEAALALATEKPFDVIFLDVQMPGMNGFTTCSRIHETVQNRTTPVVFVTGHSDFKAHSQTTVSGGCDFMVKPFLMAEITVKALTFALRGRLQELKTAQKVTLLPKEEAHKQDNLVPAFA